MTTFDPAEFERFEYVGHHIDPTDGVLRCGYRLVGPARSVEFTEEFGFGPFPPQARQAPRAEAIAAAAELLWLAAGLSYYKAAAPPVVGVPGAVGPAARAWLEALYREGLGEFAYVNDIDLSRRPSFDIAGQRVPRPATGLGLPRRSLVPVGGGKDSCVTIDVMQAADDEATVLFNVGGHRPAREVAAASGLPMVTVARTLDPALLDLNRQGALNGHVPITAIISAAAIVTALITGADRVVMSNERSANAPNFARHGLPVNHQYSKSLVAEARLRAALAEVTAEVDYFSLLRPLSELQIASLFARSSRFWPVFTSCNAAFRLDAARRVDRWCGHCPKCRFVFLALAPFLDRAELVGIFGTDVLSDPEQVSGYRELLGLAGHKPFECVGEIEESRVALRLVADAGGWSDSPVVDTLVEELGDAGLAASDELVTAVFTASSDHFVPPAVADLLTGALKGLATGGTR